jgi:uncharacterized membrane protein YdjX (TVP38/TMEM64 family)
LVDDGLCSVGSANFNNRSMGFDIGATSPSKRAARRIRRGASLRNRLLAEHLDTTLKRRCGIARQDGSLIGAIDALASGRTLALINTASADLDLMVAASALVDPERPADPEVLINEFVPAELGPPMAGRIARLGVELLIVAAVAMAWLLTPLQEWTSAESIARFADRPLSPFIALAIYTLGGLLDFPITLLIIATCLVFGSLAGGLYALGGVLLSAAVTYVAGRLLGRDTVRRLAGSRLNAVTHRLASKGMWAIARLRLLPIASFSVLNLVAGASRIRLRNFMLGTALGMTPWILLMMTFVDRVRAVLTEPGPVSYALIAAVSALIVVAVLFVRRRFGFS